MTAEKVLMVAFHLPPSAISSGHLRPLGFARHLPSFGWVPVMLSANARAYPRTDPESVKRVPDNTLVCRAFAIDTKRHLAIGGRYPSILAQPDRWASWWPGAVYLGLRLIRRYDIRAIWSTYPIMTAHCVALTLSRLTGLPWIADFRDPVTSSVAGQSRLTQSVRMRCERSVVTRATYSVFTTPGAMQSYAERYPGAYGEGRLKIIPNGFDESDFADVPAYRQPKSERPIHLVHSGILYPDGRNPKPFFEALAGLRNSGAMSADDIRVTLRASGSEATYGAEIERLGLGNMVALAPTLPYREALAEQSQADGLLLFQGDQYDHQIPAKVYEYLRVGRPIFALVGARGDTAALLRESGGATLVSPDNVVGIGKHLETFLRELRAGQAQGARLESVARYSREAGASSLARLLGKAMDSRASVRVLSKRGTR